jgi:hypothetical protein
MSKKSPTSEEIAATVLYVSQADIEQSKADWSAQLAKVRETIQALSREITAAQHQELALDGALQACDALIQKVK